MRYVFHLPILMDSTNPMVREILEVTHFDMRVLASASIRYMLSAIRLNPNSNYDLSKITDPYSLDIDGSLEHYLFEYRVSRMGVPYSKDQLTHIVGELATFIMFDMYHKFRNLIMGYGIYNPLSFSVIHCNFNKMEITLNG